MVSSFGGVCELCVLRFVGEVIEFYLIFLFFFGGGERVLFFGVFRWRLCLRFGLGL